MGLVEDLKRLWTMPFTTTDEALTAFRTTYADPVSVNGVDVSVTELVERATAMQRAFADLELEVIQHVESAEHLVLVFWQRGRHVGVLETALGMIEPTGRRIEVRVIDVLSINDGRISQIQVVPDNLAMLMQLRAVRLADVR